MSVVPASDSPRGLFASPYLLLTLTSLFWGANTIAGQLAVGHISAVSLTCLRWIITGTIMLGLYRKGLREHWPALRPRVGFLAVMGVIGFTAYNYLFYMAAHSTSALNINIITAAMPAMVLVGALLVFGQKVRLLQWLGMILSIAGVVLVAARGDLSTLRTLTFSHGDLLVTIGTALYALYTMLLRIRPSVPSLVFFAAITPVAALSSIVLLGIEIGSGDFSWPTLQGWLVLIYVAIFPSLLGQIFFIRAVELIGSGRASQFFNLIPIFGSALAIAILGEDLAWYHIVALAMVLGGIYVAERRRG